jgi:hypothetical protein
MPEKSEPTSPYPSRRGYFIAAMIGFGLGACVFGDRRPSLAELTRPTGFNPAGPQAKTRGTAVEVASADKLQDGRPRMLVTYHDSGSYVLASDIPDVRTRREEQVANAVSASMTRVRGKYISLYADLGIDVGTSERLVHHVAQIYKAKVLAVQAMDQLNLAQIDYDRRMEALLGSDYEKYRSIEASYPAQEEFARLKAFCADESLPLDDDESKITDLISRSEAYSFQTLSGFGGPYQGIPRTFGGKMAVPIFELQLATLREHAAALLRSAAEANCGGNTITALRRYYQKQTAVIDELIGRAKDPTAPLIKALTSQLESMKNDPHSDPTAIARVKAQLESAVAFRKRQQ